MDYGKYFAKGYFILFLIYWCVLSPHIRTHDQSKESPSGYFFPFALKEGQFDNKIQHWERKKWLQTVHKIAIKCISKKCSYMCE